MKSRTEEKGLDEREHALKMGFSRKASRLQPQVPTYEKQLLNQNPKFDYPCSSIISYDVMEVDFLAR